MINPWTFRLREQTRALLGACRSVISIALLAMMAIGSPLAGCQDVLFPANTPRTQFESYDKMRNQAAPVTEYDALGRETPALRARLAPR